mmetsp:Transcript_8922/g.20984  ORF Transcript_8922/g.20984 Transcript_8922/m.20984 type:complete len:123 (-) Transcript_8922:12-380(-)
MASLWLHRFFCTFGFVALVLAVLVVTCAETSVALTYFQLIAEDHRWWWRSFFTSACSAVYVFLYSVYYFVSDLDIERPVSMVLYFGYMLIISVSFFLLTGSIGTLASFNFVQLIYSSAAKGD